MKKTTLFLLFICNLFIIGCTNENNAQVETAKAGLNAEAERADYAIVIHGGAGTILKENMTDEKEQAYRDALNGALDIGEKILAAGGDGKDAVVETIKYLENIPLFNAGKGAVFTNEGVNELDASFMDGATRNAGAIGGVRIIKNPITAAREVMENSEHVMLTGKGAEQFAIERGLDTVDNKYFYTQDRWESLQRVIAKENKQTGVKLTPFDEKFGTVGCVVLDKAGNLIAGTSTGGMTNKRYNRIGDSPIIGAGTYANNETCAVSCTGHGEYFIRYQVAYDISAMMEYKDFGLQQAADYVVNTKLKTAGGTGGVIAVDNKGNVAMPFNTAGMYRGYAKPNGERVVEIYK
ncbi:MAG: isoaspartyl peptidase/L-asparaginase family protein [Saprospiraceae bacterium]